MFRHRDDPLIGNLDGQSLQSLIKNKLHRYPARHVAFGWIGATFSQASRYRPRRAHADARSRRTELNGWAVTACCKRPLGPLQQRGPHWLVWPRQPAPPRLPLTVTGPDASRHANSPHQYGFAGWRVMP